MALTIPYAHTSLVFVEKSTEENATHHDTAELVPMLRPALTYANHDSTTVTIPLAHHLFIYKSLTVPHNSDHDCVHAVQPRRANIIPITEGDAMFLDPDSRLEVWRSRGGREFRESHSVIASPTGFQAASLGVRLPPQKGSSSEVGEDLLTLICYPWLVLLYTYIADPTEAERLTYRGPYHQERLLDLVKDVHRLKFPLTVEAVYNTATQEKEVQRIMASVRLVDTTPTFVRSLIHDLLVATTLPETSDKMTIKPQYDQVWEMHSFVWGLASFRDRLGLVINVNKIL